MTTTDNATDYTVLMAGELQDDLDAGFSPFDGVAAIEEMFRDLPKLHKPRRLNRVLGWTRVYRGRYGWTSTGFSYVQVGRVLHVIDLWDDDDWAKPNRREFGPVLGNITA